MTQIAEAIGKVEDLYRAVTGNQIPISNKPYAPIPAEKDPSEHVAEQMRGLLAMLTPETRGDAMPPMAPPISVLESDAEILICMELPGVRRENVNVSVQENILTVTANRSPTGPMNGHRLRMTERPWGLFQRTVLLPAKVGGEGMTAQLKDGILELRIPKETKQFASAQTVPVN